MNAPFSSLLALRASGLPLAFLCAGSARPAELRINSVNDAAATGTATHKALETLPITGMADWSRIDEICDELGGDSEEVRMLCGRAQRMWRELWESFPAAETEVSVDMNAQLTDAVLTGHIDLVSVAGYVVRVLDWKSGRKDGNYAQQAKAYLTMKLLSREELQEGTATIAWIRDQEIESYTMTRSDAEAWLEDLRRRVIRWDGTYHPGTHCQYCQRFHECAAANALTRTYVASIADLDLSRVPETIAQMEPEPLVDLYQRAKVVDRLSDSVLNAIRARVISEGDIDSGTTRLTINTEKHRELDPIKTWPVLTEEGFTDDDFAAVIKIQPSKLDKRVAQRAGKGAGAAANRALKDKLEMAGAIEFNEVKKLEAKRSS